MTHKEIDEVLNFTYNELLNESLHLNLNNQGLDDVQEMLKKTIAEVRKILKQTMK